jgi:hypothetical protein
MLVIQLRAFMCVLVLGGALAAFGDVGDSPQAPPFASPIIQTGLPAGAAGVYTWGNWNPEKVNRQTHPLIRGVPMTLHWRLLEPEPDRFEFDTLVGDMLRAARDNHFYVHLMVWFSPDSPQWLYDAGIPRVEVPERINPQRKRVKKTFPYYLDEQYTRYYHRVIRELGRYVHGLPADLRDRIIFVQCAEGSTGDGQPYKGEPLDSRYDISFERWNEFRIQAWGVYKEAFQPAGKKAIPLLVNNDANRGSEHEWLLANLPSVGAKQGMFSHGYHISDTQTRLANWHAFLREARGVGLDVFTRGEQDAEWKVCGWSSRNPQQGFYWSALFALHCGLDVWNIPYEASAGYEIQDAIQFFNKHAGHHDPASATAAFCALRRGLDASDTVAFPEEQFGKASKINTDRYLKIAAAFAGQRAIQGDPEKAIRGGMINRQRDDYNDVGWGILPGNYEMYLQQIEPDSTSAPYWHVEPESHVYSRFARGFNQKAGQTAMAFRLDTRFFGKTNKPRAVTVRVVYLDRGRGEWSLDYNAGGQRKSAVVVGCENTGEWKEAIVTLRDAVFNQGLPGSADLILRHVAGADTIFHMIELDRR